MMIPEIALSVTDLTLYIRGLFEQDTRLKDVWVQGEVSNFRKASSGHLYFTLKDGRASMRCVVWKSTAMRMHSLPREGDAVMAHGYVSVYDPQGEYQLYADRVRPVGVGDLYAQFERLKSQLEAESLFDAERKRPLPVFPHVIGVVTSPEAAAFQDVLNVLRRRFPLTQVVLSPTLVQGAEAPPQIVRAIDRLNRRTDVEVILVCRGGGSIEDLWAFNDEGVARAVASSRLPVISGVGHEVDFTICDFAADERAPTPSAAAEMLTPDIAELRAGVAWLGDQLRDRFTRQLNTRREDLDSDARALRSFSPLARVRIHRQRLDDWSARLNSAQKGRVALLHERVAARGLALTAASPAAILARGYALVTDAATGARITSSRRSDAASTQWIVQFHDGRIHVNVEEEQ
ncbi:MAG: exodeoxyribonuclease VII large subunit [Chloroflexi bacterium]|nr:exodeoxyribonuclease VII large subunit [Chloroflexota bacterium]